MPTRAFPLVAAHGIDALPDCTVKSYHKQLIISFHAKMDAVTSTRGHTH